MRAYAVELTKLSSLAAFAFGGLYLAAKLVA